MPQACFQHDAGWGEELGALADTFLQDVTPHPRPLPARGRGARASRLQSIFSDNGYSTVDVRQVSG